MERIKLDLTLKNIFVIFRRGWQEYCSPLDNIWYVFCEINIVFLFAKLHFKKKFS